MKSHEQISQPMVPAALFAVFLAGVALLTVFTARPTFTGQLAARSVPAPGVVLGLFYFFSTMPQVLAAMLGLVLIVVAIRSPKLVGKRHIADDEIDQTGSRPKSADQPSSRYESTSLDRNSPVTAHSGFLKRLQRTVLGTFILIAVCCFQLPFVAILSRSNFTWGLSLMATGAGFCWLLVQFYQLVTDCFATGSERT